MRIAYIVAGFPLRSETFVVSQIAGMAARGCDVEIFATGRSTGALPAVLRRRGLQARVHRIDPPRGRAVRLARIMFLLLGYGWRTPKTVIASLNVRRYGRAAVSLGLLYEALTIVRSHARRFDVIHAQFGSHGVLASRLVAVGALDGPLVTSFRGYDATGYLKENAGAYDNLFRAGELFLPVCQALAERVEEAGCDPARVRVLHSGIDCRVLTFRERGRPVDGVARVVIAGRLVEKKGVADGLRAIGQVVSRGGAITCTVAGDGPLRDQLESLACELGLERSVTFTGWLSHDDVIRLMERSDILLAPSVRSSDGDEEGIPNVLKEAMALGMPAVATMHAGIPELVTDGKSGYLVPERDVSQLADRIERLLAEPERWAAMGREGRRRVEAEFDIERLNDVLLELYRELAAQRDAAGGR